MNLPIYQIIYLKNGQFDELEMLLKPDLNFKNPVVFDLTTLEIDQQRETIGLIENYYSNNNYSYKYPYPVYIASACSPSVSDLIVVKNTQELPKFFRHKEGKIVSKEVTLINKNKLYQQEIRNIDNQQITNTIKKFATSHRKMYLMDKEKNYYQSLIDKLGG